MKYSEVKKILNHSKPPQPQSKWIDYKLGRNRQRARETRSQEVDLWLSFDGIIHKWDLYHEPNGSNNNYLH